MIYYKGPAYYDRPFDPDLRAMLRRVAGDHPESPAYAYRLKPKQPAIFKTYAQLLMDVEALGEALYHWRLLAPGEALALLGENSYAWAVTHATTVCGLGLSVPLDKQLAEPEFISLINRSQARVVCLDAAHWRAVPAIEAACPSVTAFIYLHAPEQAAPDALQADPRHYSFGQLLTEGHRLLKQGHTAYRQLPIDPSQPCGLFFTSGTTAQSKGVLLSHHNITTNYTNGLRSLYCKPGSRCLSILPIHHTFENTVGMFAQLSNHNCIYFNDGLRYFLYNLKDWQIEVILAVPLLLESVYKQLQLGIQKAGKQALVARLRKVSRFLMRLHIDVRRRLFQKILAELGGHLKLIIAGAAALSPEVCQFFYDIGIDCMLGYGLTESGPMIAANTQRCFRPGSVGLPLADHEVRIDNGLDWSDAEHPGEILARTPSIMVGYYQDPEATAQVLDEEGWLHTGDVGYLDAEGCLYITGRQKSMIVLTNGKKVFPEELEALLQGIPGVQAAYVWGETNARSTVDPCASLLIDRSKLPEAQKAQDDAGLAQWLHGRIQALNEQIPVYKAIKYFLWSDAGMPLTTTLKVRRALEFQRIHSFLNTRGKTMREADRSRITGL